MAIVMAGCFLTFIRLQFEIQRSRARDARGAHHAALAWRRRLRASVSLAVLFGLTWASSILLLIGSHVVFQWLFVVFVATQGIFIFYFQVFTQRTVHEAVSKLGAEKKKRENEVFSNLSVAKSGNNYAGKSRHLSSAFSSINSFLTSLFFSSVDASKLPASVSPSSPEPHPSPRRPSQLAALYINQSLACLQEEGLQNDGSGLRPVNLVLADKDGNLAQPLRSCSSQLHLNDADELTKAASISPYSSRQSLHNITE